MKSRDLLGPALEVGKFKMEEPHVVRAFLLYHP
jgi:hypothetical protein